MTLHRIDVRLPAGPRAAALARRAIDELSAMLPPALMEDLRLLVSELVTNSVRHAGTADDIRLWVRVGATSIRVEVRDTGSGFEVPTAPDPSAESGWGLYLVDEIAKSWGAEAGPPSSVWFELDR